MATIKARLKEKVLTISQVVSLTGYSRTTLWRMGNAGTFPERRVFAPGVEGWLKTEIDKWVKSFDDILIVKDKKNEKN